MLENLTLTPRERAELVWPMTAELQMEAAMCLWEEFNERTLDASRIGPELRQYRERVGTVEARHELMNLVDALHIGWHVHLAAADDPLIPFDWEFTPWFLAKCVEVGDHALELKPDWLQRCREARMA